MIDQQKMIEEHKTIREAIVNITLAWSHLENTLALILARVIDPVGPATYAFAIFYSVASADAKISIVDAVFTTLLESSPHEQKIRPLWEKTLKLVSRVKKVRNAVAHGQISTTAIGGKNYVRLTPPIFDWRRMHPPVLKGQPPGLSAHDLDQTARRIGKVTSLLDHHLALVQALIYRNVPDEVLLEKLQELEADLMRDQDPRADQTPAKN